MHILPFLGSTTSSILGTGVGSSMSFVRSSCSSSSFCPLLFPYKAVCLKQIIHKLSASCSFRCSHLDIILQIPDYQLILSYLRWQISSFVVLEPNKSGYKRPEFLVQKHSPPYPHINSHKRAFVWISYWLFFLRAQTRKNLVCKRCSVKVAFVKWTLKYVTIQIKNPSSIKQWRMRLWFINCTYTTRLHQQN